MKAKHKAMDTKVCPSCNSTLFADMDVCYGCLYDFNRVSQAPVLVCPEQLDAPYEDVPYEAELQPPLEAYMWSGIEASHTSECTSQKESYVQASEQDGYAQDGPIESAHECPQGAAQASKQNSLQTTAQASRQNSLQTTEQASPQPQASCCSQVHDNCKLITVGDAQVVILVRGNN